MITFSPLNNTREVLPILSRIAIFGGATESQQQEIFRRLEIGVIEKGSYIFQKGDEPSHIYIVKSGEIELLIPGADVTIQKKKLGIGECVGQVALMSMQSHAVSAVAGERSELIVLSRRAMHQLRHEDIELFALLMMNIARELARRLNFTDEMLLDSYHEENQHKAGAETTFPPA
jgi:CRP/FNR family transcriptional regulator, cyclic AMP receptor protein